MSEGPRARLLAHGLFGPAMALFGGAVVALSLPPFGWWPLAPLGCALLAASLFDASARGRLLRGYCFGLGQFAISLYFIIEFSGVGYIVLIAFEALFPAVAAVLRSRRAPGCSLAGAIALAEWARGHVPFGGLPPGGIPLVAGASPYGPVARLGGPAMVTLVVVASGAGLAALVRAAPRQRRAAGDGSREGLALILASVALVLLGMGASAGGAASGGLVAVGVQGGGPRGLHQISVPGLSAFNRSYEESLAIKGAVRLVLWPEDTVPLPTGPPAHTALGERLAALARSLHATVLAGVTEPIGSTKFLNEQAEFGPSGAYLGAVVKVHAVPFGEYIPYRTLLSHLVSLSAVPRDAVVGHNDGVLKVGATHIGVVISFETFFPDRGREEVRAGASALVVPTNTASYATTQVPTQELAGTRLQALATGRDVLQAATTGYSALVTPSGAVEKVTRLDEPALVSVVLPLRNGLTLYDRFGELPVLIVAALAVLGGWLRRRRRAPS